MTPQSLKVTPIKTKTFTQGSNIIDFILESVPQNYWHEGLTLAITSKIVSLAESRTVPISQTTKANLIEKEAEYVLGPMGYGSVLTIKQGLLLASAGIDESNSADGSYILLPTDPFKSAQEIHNQLIQKLGLNKLGVILTDSRTSPLRLGVTGVALSFAGFHPVRNLVGQKDLFDRPLKMTQVNIVDSLAAIAVLTMGEASESQPLAIIENAGVEFDNLASGNELIVPTTKDMYFPLYSHLLK